LREQKLRCFYWIDLYALSELFLEEGQCLVSVKYFTAHVKGNPSKSKRQNTFLDAVRADNRIQIILGNYQREPITCNSCLHINQIPKEKQTDTNIATEMVADAFLNLWDKAVLVSADADLVPPIRCIKKHIPKKTLIVAFPPNRILRELAREAHGEFHINKSMLTDCQLDRTVNLKNGVRLTCPEYWK
jgi:uncharacterized LabA/DUF88 family protein